MVQAAKSKEVDPDRISFTASIQVLSQAIIQSAMASQEQTMRILKRVCADSDLQGSLGRSPAAAFQLSCGQTHLYSLPSQTSRASQPHPQTSVL